MCIILYNRAHCPRTIQPRGGGGGGGGLRSAPDLDSVLVAPPTDCEVIGDAVYLTTIEIWITVHNDGLGLLVQPSFKIV